MSSRQPNIRPARFPEDVDFMKEILLYAAGDDTSDPRLNNYSLVLAQNRFTGLVAEVANKLDDNRAGSIWYGEYTAEHPGFAYQDGTREVTLGIRQEFRGKGIGTLLMAELVVVARERGVPALVLEVDVKNKPALRIYNGAGFMPNRQEFGGYQTMRLDLM